MIRLRTFFAFLIAVILMAAAGTVAQTQFVLAALEAAGAPANLWDRLAMTGADLIGFAPLYAALIALGFAIAFLAAGLLTRRLNLPRVPMFAIAAGVAIGAMLVLMREAFFGVPLIAGARTTGGVAAQVACGALAGAAFAALSAHETRR